MYPPVDQTIILLSFQVYSSSGSVLSGTKGLISELKPEQNNLPRQYRSYTTCKEKKQSKCDVGADMSKNNILFAKKSINVFHTTLSNV